MSEWNRVSLRDMSTHIKDGTHGTHQRVESGVPFLSAKNIGSNGRLSWDEGDDLVSESDYSAITSTFTPKQGDVLLTVVGSIGRTALFDGSKVAFQRSVAFIRCSDDVLPAFLYQAISSADFVRQLERRCNVTAQAGLYLGELAKCQISLPPGQQQQKIAAILTATDSAIEKAEALIAKYQQIKAGLMHDLFTRGVLPDGQLRPPRSEAPVLYQETAIGWIPREWQVAKLGTMAKIVSGVTLGSKESPTDSIDAPYLRVANVQDGYLDLTEIKTVRVSRKTLEYLRLLPGDVLMNEGGDFDKLGRGAVWTGEIEDCVHQNHVFRVRADSAVLRPYYLAYYSESSFGKKYFLLSSKQSTNLASINSTQLNAYPIALPSSAEQDAIVFRVSSANCRIGALKAEAEKLRTQKLGLMQDLLTGKVPVQVDEPETEVTA